MKTTKKTTRRAALTMMMATTRSVATRRSITWAAPIQVSARKPMYQQTRNPKAPDRTVS